MDLDQFSDEIEIVSQNYAKKFNIERDADWFVFKLQEEIGELTQAYLMMKGRARMKGKDMEEIRRDFEEEIGDVFCHILLLTNHFHVDVKKVVDEKWLKWNNAKELSEEA